MVDNVFASFAGGTASLLKTKEDGILVQDGDPYVYAGAIVHLFEHFDYAKQLGESSRLKAMKRHDPEKIASRLLDAYYDIMQDFKGL